MTRFNWIIALLILSPAAAAQTVKAPASVWRDWIEQDFPCFSTTLDAGTKDSPNLTSRALVFPLDEVFVAYDIDLLRIAAVWKVGDFPFRDTSMAVNSYPYGGNKVGPGTDALPKPDGTILLQNGMYPGVWDQILFGAAPRESRFADPRDSLSPRERVVRGGLEPKHGRFCGVDLANATIEYEVANSIRIRERFRVEKKGLVRQLMIDPHEQPITFVLAQNASVDDFDCDGMGAVRSMEGHVVCEVAPFRETHNVQITCRFSEDAAKAESPVQDRRWTKKVRLPIVESTQENTLTLESIPLPLDNPYGRAVRVADVEFFKNGRAVVLTFDGDIWFADGFQTGSREVTWSRFTSGLHEPLRLAIRDGEIFVFDRSGLWRILDRDENGEADYHELFCSRIDQTVETREFACSLEAERDGSFLVSKPGQSEIYSSILRVSPDGKNVSIVARGFRQPFLGYDAKTHTIAMCDQQGNWVPSTPIAFVQPGKFYGYPFDKDDETLSITSPLTWIPHIECSSAMGVVWMRGAKLGPLNDQPIVLCYHRPRLLQLFPDIEAGVQQGGATPLDIDISEVPLLNATINPTDGLLYLAGFQIWGSSAKEKTYLGRIRHNPAQVWTQPIDVRSAKRGVLLQFQVPLDATLATNPRSYRVRRWNYRRTKEYGSGNYRMNGEAGTDAMPVASATLSNDGKSVFLGIPDMQPVMQMEVDFKIAAAKENTPVENQAFLTVHELRSIDLLSKGFAANDVDMILKETHVAEETTQTPSIERGAQLYARVGCIGCHSIDGTTTGKNGPSWLKLYGQTRRLVDSKQEVIAGEAYLKESILKPNAKVAVGAIQGEAGMPIYEGVLRDDQIESLVLFIKSLDGTSPQSLAMNDVAERNWKVEDFRAELTEGIDPGSAERGRLVFLGATCFSCHQVGAGKGGRLGPDLSKLERSVSGLELLQHILEPSLKIDDKYKMRTIVTDDGQVHQGFLVSEDEAQIRLSRDPLASRETVTISKTEIDEVSLTNISPMPTGLLNRSSKKDVLDLLGYLESIAGQREKQP